MAYIRYHITVDHLHDSQPFNGFSGYDRVISTVLSFDGPHDFVLTEISAEHELDYDNALDEDSAVIQYRVERGIHA